jgi:hypothetical protein
MQLIATIRTTDGTRTITLDGDDYVTLRDQVTVEAGETVLSYRVVRDEVVRD